MQLSMNWTYALLGPSVVPKKCIQWNTQQPRFVPWYYIRTIWNSYSREKFWCHLPKTRNGLILRYEAYIFRQNYIEKYHWINVTQVLFLAGCAYGHKPSEFCATYFWSLWCIRGNMLLTSVKAMLEFFQRHLKLDMVQWTLSTTQYMWIWTQIIRNSIQRTHIIESADW